MKALLQGVGSKKNKGRRVWGGDRRKRTPYPLNREGTKQGREAREGRQRGGSTGMGELQRRNPIPLIGGRCATH